LCLGLSWELLYVFFWDGCYAELEGAEALYEIIVFGKIGGGFVNGMAIFYVVSYLHF